MDKIFEINKTTGTLVGYVDEISDGLDAKDPKYDKYKDLVIPEEIDEMKVKRIGDSAFYNNELTSVTIPESVTEIGGCTFAGNKLTSVIIPNSVIKICNCAFWDNQLTSVNFFDGVKYIGYEAFKGNQLTSVIIPESVVTIGNHAFWNNQLTSVTIPDSVIDINKNAFDDGVKIVANELLLNKWRIRNNYKEMGKLIEQIVSGDFEETEEEHLLNKIVVLGKINQDLLGKKYICDCDSDYGHISGCKNGCR